MKSGNLLSVQVGAGSVSDNTFGSKIRDTINSSDLILRYLGYFNFEDFLDIEKREAFLKESKLSLTFLPEKVHTISHVY